MKIKESNKTAKKQYTCNFCGLPIKAGETYNRATCIEDGCVYTWRSHIACYDLTAAITAFEEYGDGITEEDFHDVIEEEYTSLMSEQGIEGELTTFEEILNYVINHYSKQS